MADFSCDRNAKALELKAGRKVLETPTDPKHSEPELEARTMPHGEEYSASVCAGKSQQYRNAALSAQREARRVVVFFADDLDAAMDQIVTYARAGVDMEFAINGMPRPALPWRMPNVKISPATAVLAAQYLAKDRGATGAQLLSEAMMMVGTECVIEGLCVAEDLALIADNFTERFGGEE